MSTRYVKKYYYIKNRENKYLDSMEAGPKRWNDRHGIPFKTRKAAEAVICELFVGPNAARELLGVHVVSE